MIKEFSVEGFKNFRDKFTINFSDVRDYRFNSECVVDGLLNTVVIYGKNAVGKTNFGLALFDVVSHLTMNNVTPGLYDYFLNVESNHVYAEFAYTFKFDSDEVVYKYHKIEASNLLMEQLLLNGEEMFRGESIHKNGEVKLYHSKLMELAPNFNWEHKVDGSFIKYFLFNSPLGADHPFSKMLRFINRMLWFRSLDENRYIGYKENASDYLSFIFEKSEYVDEFNQLLKQANIDESVVAKKDVDGKMRLYFDTKSPMPFFRVASNGTKALYNFFYWHKTSSDVSFMYIDEFDAFYHYELSEAIVNILGKMDGFQKILTSHNTGLLSNRIMRPDCYFILTKDKITSIANATERELREGHNLEKLYVNGEFNG